MVIPRRPNFPFECTRIGRPAPFETTPMNVSSFLEIVDELHELGIEFISAREAIDTTGAMGRMFITLVGSIAELERSLITERIRAGMRRARLEGQRLGRAPLNIDHDALVRDRLAGMSLTSAAKKYGVRVPTASLTTCRNDAQQALTTRTWAPSTRNDTPPGKWWTRRNALIASVMCS